MLNHFKQIKREYSNKRKIVAAYKGDCKNYLTWQYHNPNLKTKEAMEAKILRHTHILEKGMSLSNPKPQFGVQRANELLTFLDEFVKYGFNPDESTVFQNALGVLHAYLDFHRERGFEPEEIISIVQKWNDSTPKQDESYGICSVTFDELNEQIHGEFPEFFNSRHAIRQFSDESVTEDEIKKAVAVAMRAPSACNRQSCKVYFFTMGAKSPKRK
jgi:hypothetical protein